MNKKTIAIIFMLLSAFSFSLMSVMVKMTSNLPFVEAVFFRNLISLFIAYIISKRNNISIIGSRENQKYLLARSIFGLIGVNCYFYSIQNMALADSAIINKMSPFFVLIFATVILKEKIKPMQIFAVLIAFFGITFIINPEFNSDIFPALVGLFAACTAGIAYTIVRMLSGREHPSTVVLYFSLVSVIGMTPFLIFYFQIPSLSELFFLIMTGVFAAGGQYGLTYAYKLAKASEVSIYSYATVIFSSFIGFLLFRETLNQTTIIGITIVLLSGYLNYYIVKKRG